MHYAIVIHVYNHKSVKMQ